MNIRKKQSFKAFLVAMAMVLSLFGGITFTSKKAFAEPDDSGEKTFTVTFDSAGGTEVAAQAVKEGDNAVQPDDPENGELLFLGWFVDPTYENIINYETFEYNTFDFDAEITEDVTLTAVWVAEVNAEIAGAGYGNINCTYEGEEIDEDYFDSIYFSAIIGIKDKVVLDAKATDDGRFVKWQKVISAGESYEDSECEDYSTEETITIDVTEPIKLVALFEAIDETAEDDTEDNTDEDTTDTEDENTETPTEEIVTGTEKVTVTFDSNGGSEVAAVTVDKGTKAVKPEDPTNGSLEFIGWFVDPTLDNIIDYEKIEYNTFDFDSEITEDVTLTALWGAITRIETRGEGLGKVNYIDEGGEEDELAYNSIVIPAIMGLYDTFVLTAKAEEGSRFVKWQKVIVEGETDEDSQYEDYSTDEVITFKASEPISLVARFEYEETASDGNAQEAKIEEEPTEAATEATAQANIDNSAETGDDSQPIFALIIMIGALAGTCYVIFRKKKER